MVRLRGFNANVFLIRVKQTVPREKNPRARRGFMAINQENRYGMLAV